MYSEPWLPDCALRSSYAVRALASVTNGWLADWLPSNDWRTGECFVPVVDRDGWTRLRGDDGYTIVGRSRAMMDLAHAVLGRKTSSPTADRDAQLLRRIATAALDDCLQRVERVVPPGGYEAGDGRLWELVIGPANAPVIALQLTQAAVVTLVRDAVPARAAIRPMSNVREVVRNTPLAALASLGTATLAVDQIIGIEIDDIILLDTAPDDPVGLAVEDISLGRRFRFAQSDGLISLELTK